ncbi:MAG: GNAT family N-acetyltransferase, partial [Rubrobacteraceae bacterium]
MTSEDVEVAYQTSSNAFADNPEDRARIENRTPEEIASRQERLRHLLCTDPDGAWIADDDDGRMAGVAVALRREGLWVLSLLPMAAEYRSRGIGKALLGHALAYAEGCRGALIASSSHPAA